MAPRRTSNAHATRHTAAILSAVALAASLALSAGCRGDRSEAPPRQFFPDLDDQPKFKSQVKSTFYEEFAPDEYGGERWGRAARLPVDNTVAFGDWPLTDPVMGVDFADRERLLRINPAVYEGRTASGEVIDDIPIEVDEQLLALGKKKYNIYCIVCHGGTGAGDGLVGRRWVSPVPSYHQQIYQKGSGEPQSRDGHLYDVIRNGVQNPPGIEPRYRMRPYGNSVTPREAWAIVAYVRALQMTRRGELDMLDESDRNRLIQQRNRADAPAADPAQHIANAADAGGAK
jgi:mono/diheme cytochrome c family protein